MNKNSLSQLPKNFVPESYRKVSVQPYTGSMTKNKIRHIPIVKNKEPIGMVSIGDVVNRLLEKYQSEAELLREYITL